MLLAVSASQLRDPYSSADKLCVADCRSCSSRGLEPAASGKGCSRGSSAVPLCWGSYPHLHTAWCSALKQVCCALTSACVYMLPLTAYVLYIPCEMYSEVTSVSTAVWYHWIFVMAPIPGNVELECCFHMLVKFI